ncbi:MAG TPA: hypothetical protein V6D29_21025 [Leptolyngbyaceae cyanobacterium]
MIHIKRHDGGWHFASEVELEDFVWEYLPQLFDLQPLSRQYFADSYNRCDILAVSQNGQLAIIELKIGADDGIISQLTRYYHVIQSQQPFSEQVDYSLPIQLIAIAPNFHPSNLLDAEYSRLLFQLIQYEVKDCSGKLYFQLYDYITGTLITDQPVPFKAYAEAVVEAPPRALKQLLALCDDCEMKGLLAARSKILASDHRLKEEVKNGSIFYSKGKSLPVAKICLDKPRQRTFLHLYLPYQSSRGRQTVSGKEAKIWTDGERVTDIGFILRDRMKPITHEEWIDQKFKLTDERSIIEAWVKTGVINESDLVNKDTRRILLAKYNWGHSDWGLALPISFYQGLLERYGITREPASCRTLLGLTDLALQEFQRKAA